MKIAVLSDTHGLLRPEAAKVISECDAVIHGGDINSQKIIDEMKAAAKEDAPIYIVRGNNDKGWAEHLPHHLEFTLAGMNFYVIHNKKELPADLGDRQIIIFGHSHRYFEEKKDGRLWLNPGSCGKRRFDQDITLAILRIEGDACSVERIDIEHEASWRKVSVRDGDLFPAIRGILKRMEKGQQVEQIAADMKLDQEFVEQICRIKVTHPGVTAHGILDKVEVNRTGR
ncbi:MAG TPA: metallophosphatase family protein [Candidatus Mediterraneibacter intestinavium]|nr:metallophosphatase family protein [Candidatus Mediterraneibacter intestinavium]